MIYIFSIAVCIAPVFAILLPFIGGLNISSVWIFYYILILSFIITFPRKPHWQMFNFWLVILSVYYCICILSVSWSDYYTFNIETIRDLMRNCLGPYLIAFIGLYLLRTEKLIHIFMRSFMFAAVLAAGVAIVQMLLGRAPNYETARAVASFKNPNLLAIFLVLSIPCVLHLIRYGATSKILGWISFFIINVGLLSTVSRKGVFSAILVMFIYFIFSKQYKKIIILGGIGIISGMILLSSNTSMSKRFSTTSILYNLDHKVEFVRYGTKMFLDSPVIGLGYKGYYKSFGRYAKGALVKNYQAHNIFITEIANRGLVGFFPFMAIFLFPFFSCIRQLITMSKRSIQDIDQGVALVTTCSLFSFMLNGYFAGGLFFNYIIMALVYSQVAMFYAYTKQ